MPLAADQRAWLDKALREKGRFTLKKTIENEWGDYVRRREKTAEALAGLPQDHTDRAFLNQALTDADDLAKRGKFNDAYKSLNSAKKRARGAAGDRAKDIYNDDIRIQTNIIENSLDSSKKEVDFAVRHLNDVIQKAVRHKKAQDETDFDKAAEFRKSFVADEAILRGDFDGALKYMDLAANKVLERNLPSRFERVEMDIKALQAAGRGRDIAEQVKRVADLKTAAKANDERYWEWFWLINQPEPRKLEFERALTAIKSLDKWQQREGQDVKPDQTTGDIRSKNLNATDNLKALLKREDDRIAWASQQIKAEQARDANALKDTSRGKVTLTPEPKRFDAAAAFGDLSEDFLPRDVAPEEAARLQQAAEAKLKSFLAGVDPRSDEMFDLSLKSAKDFKVMLAEQLLGVTNPKKWSESQKELLQQLAGKLEQTLCESSPNKVAGDGSTLTMNGVTYQLDSVIKQGGNGMARRYKDAKTGQTVVVKTLLRSSEKERDKMVWEMETHRRVMKGLDDNDPNSDAIVQMQGSARSADGALHMILEDVQGGDLEDVGAAMRMLQSSGVIPEAARQVLSADMIAKTVKGLMALERQGLVHHDLKGENVMLTADGRVKIIDYGESMFGDQDGVVHGKSRGSSPGYDAEEGRSGGDYTSKVDTYSLGGMIQKLAANDTPYSFDFDSRQYEQGAMSRLIKALKDDDPDKRPSLQAILMTSYMQSGESDHPPEDVQDLKAASVEFTNRLAGEKASFDLATAKANLPSVANDLTGGDMKLVKLQTMANYLDERIANLIATAKSQPDKFLLKNKPELESLQKQRAYLQSEIINKAIAEKSEAGKKAYQSAVGDTKKNVTFAGPKGQETMSLKDALARRDQVTKLIAEVHDLFYQHISGKNADLGKVQEINKRLTAAGEYRQRIDAAVYAAMGPEAKFYLSKAKLEDVSSRFAPGTRQQPQKVVQRDSPLDELLNILAKDREQEAIKNAV